MSRWKNAIVVGASSGIGEAIARRLAAGGAAVALLARRKDRLDALAEELRAAGCTSVTTHVHDVRDADSVPALYDEIEAASGPVDMLVYASGVLVPVGPDEFSFEKDRTMLEVNLLGAAAWCNQAAVRMLARRNGTILGISSIAGDRGRSGAPAYAVSKAGMTTLLEALRNRVATRGVNVVTARPGYVDTEMTRGMKGMFWTVSADRAAEICLRHAGAGTSRDRHVPARWWLVSFVVRCMPSWLLRRLSI